MVLLRSLGWRGGGVGCPELTVWAMLSNRLHAPCLTLPRADGQGGGRGRDHHPQSGGGPQPLSRWPSLIRATLYQVSLGLLPFR